MRWARLAGLAAISALLACGGAQEHAGTAERTGPISDGFGVQRGFSDARLDPGARRSNRQASLALRAGDRFAPFTGPIDTTASAYSGGSDSDDGCPVATAPGVHRADRGRGGRAPSP